MCDNSSLGWNFDSYCKNPSLTLEIIKKNPFCPWNFKIICENNFTFDNDYYLKLQQDIINKSKFIINDLKYLICKYV